ncbi:MAG TPA: DUF3313 family protein [Steroidobacteraceae bacterium]|nr:DUF3313 family protein [Steroidobacteraceae bacterium]
MLSTLMLVAPVQVVAQLQTYSIDGLELVEGPRNGQGMAVVYVRPGATLAPYKSVMLDPVEVAFDKSWMPRPSMSARDRERVRQELAEEFRIAFADELVKIGGYKIVQVADADVLRVTAAIVDLYVEAPGVGTSDWSKTYTVSASRMSLIAELRDAESGAILARVADRKVASSPGRMPGGVLHWTTRAANRAEARRTLRSWAGLLRAALDSARASAP